MSMQARIKATADKYWVSPDWVRKLKRFRRQTGNFAARKQPVSHATKLDHELPRLVQLGRRAAERHIPGAARGLWGAISQGTNWRIVRRLQITFKKR